MDPKVQLPIRPPNTPLKNGNPNFFPVCGAVIQRWCRTNLALCGCCRWLCKWPAFCLEQEGLGWKEGGLKVGQWTLVDVRVSITLTPLQALSALRFKAVSGSVGVWGGGICGDGHNIWFLYLLPNLEYSVYLRHILTHVSHSLNADGPAGTDADHPWTQPERLSITKGNLISFPPALKRLPASSDEHHSEVLLIDDSHLGPRWKITFKHQNCLWSNMYICFLETPLDLLGSDGASTTPHMLRIPRDLMGRLLSVYLWIWTLNA